MVGRSVLILGPTRVTQSSAVWPRLLSFEEAFKRAGWRVTRGFELVKDRPRTWRKSNRVLVPGWVFRRLAQLGIADELQFRCLMRAWSALRRNDHDLAVVTVPPFSLVICTILTKKPVVLDYRDVFGLAGRPHPVATALVPVERLAARHAKLISYAGGSRLGQQLTSALGADRLPILRVPNGVMTAKLRGLPNSQGGDRCGPVDIAWAGHLYGFADLRPILRALEMVGQTTARLSVIGPTPPAARRRHVHATSAPVFFAPPMQRRDLYPRLAQADIGLIVLSGSYPFEVSVPAKYYDYVAVGLPVLYIGPANAALLDEPRHSLVHHFTPEDTCGISRFLQSAAEDRRVLGPRRLCISEIDRVRSAALLIEAVEVL